MELEIEEHSYGTLKIGDCFIIGEMKEGADVGFDMVRHVSEIAFERFHGGKWGYISNRIRSYSLHPVVHHQASELNNNMIGFAVVTKMEQHLKSAVLEKRYSGSEYEFGFFEDMDSAVVWVRSLVNKA